MRLFDGFKQRKRAVPLPQLCYDVAYLILPYYAFQDMDTLVDVFLKTPATAGPFCYIMAATARQVELNNEDAERFHWHRGHLSGSREFFALEYPKPPPVDMSDVPVEQITDAGSPIVLAPYFSAIIRGNDEVQYFILGQAPMGGGTTLRCILPQGMNCNLGPGPEPILDAFLDILSRHDAAQS